MVIQAPTASASTSTLSFNANATQHQFGVISAGAVPAAVTYATGTEVTVSSNSGNLSRQGFTFGGWNTLASGLGTNYVAGSQLITVNSNIILYANWLIPSSARLIGSTGSIVTIKNDTGTSDGYSGCSSGMSGITSDGTHIFYRSNFATSVICRVGLDGEFVSSHTVSNTSPTPALNTIPTDNRDLTFSSGCIWLRQTGETANSALYCISITDWTMRTVATPSGRGLMAGSFWLYGNLIDFPDGRIGSVSAGSTTAGQLGTTFGGPNGNTTINCPPDMFCKVLRLYRPSGTGSSVSLTFSEDLVLADSATDGASGWPNDDHGIATDGTYLYQTKYNSGYKVWALTSGIPSYLVFNGAGTGTCGAGTGISNTLCPINNPLVGSAGTLANATFFGRNHVTNQYFMADYRSNKFYLSVGVAPPAGIGADKSITFTASVVTTLKYGSTTSVSYSVNRTLGTEVNPNITGTISYETTTSTACNINSATGLVTMNRAAGTCQIRVNLRSDAFYTETSSALVSITPAQADAISVTAVNRGSVFTGSAAAITPGFTVTGLQFSDTVTVTYLFIGTSNAGAFISSAEIPSAAGSYSIIPTVSLTNSDSYTAAATTSGGTLTISRAPRSVSPTTFSKLNLKYGESATVVSNATSPSTNNDGEFTYAVGSGCTNNSGTITAANYFGNCSVTTTIEQGFNYESATASAVSFSLSKADTITVSASSPAAVTFTGSAAVVTPTVSIAGLVAGDLATGATFNFGRAPNCASGGTCQVGDTGPGGGKVFHVSGSVINAVTGISGGGIYLEMAPSTFSKTTYNWCEGSGNPYTTLFGATATTIGSGAANTKIMIDNCTGGAGVQAVDLTLGGQSDWFLPSYGELVEIYSQRTMLGLGTGKYASTYLYWSSTEADTWIASSLVPWAGVGGQNKAQATPYLPIRAFSPTSTTYESPTTTPTNAGTYRIMPSAVTLSGGITTDYYVATVYETGTFAINKATQAAFTNYSTLSGVLGLALPVIKFGGNGTGAESIETTNGSATGCAFSVTLLSATAAGTCSVSASKDSSENYAQYDTVFSVNFFYYVPAPAAPVSTRQTEIAIATAVPFSATATAAPKITSISPATGPVGTVITITGTGLNGVSSVRIGRRALTSVTGVSATSVTAVISAGATTGPIVLSNSFGSDFIASGFTVTP